MKRIYGVGLLVGMMAAPQVFALTVQLPNNPNGYGPYEVGPGGEFDFGISDGTLVNSGYVTGGGGTANQALGTITGYSASFETFCVEGAETISAGSSYTAVYNNHSVYAGVYLTKGAAYLYSQFVTKGSFGGLATYNYNVGRNTTAQQLQNAIWAFMGGQEGQVMDLSNPFEKAAALAEGGTADAAGWALANATATTGYHSVYVLNLWLGGLPQNGGRAAQDQLIYTPGNIPNVIPDGGMTAMLLGMAMTGLAFISRRVRR